MDLKDKYKLVAETIRAYPLQLQESWDEVRKIKLTDDYKQVSSVLLCGMGGSALGGRIAKSVLSGRLRVPLEITNQYKLPSYADSSTLVICSSYSGNTEETVDCTYEALKRGCKVFGITKGGKLKEIFDDNKVPYYYIDEKQNPSRQPRMSIGYATGSILALLHSSGLATILEEEIEDAINVMHSVATDFHEHTPENKNLAKKIFDNIKGKGVLLVASEHLIGATHTIKNQFNENSKTFSTLFEIPELNHHLMEGLKNPARLKQDVIFLFINSSLYSDRIKKRYKVTAKVLEKCGYERIDFLPVSEKPLSQAFETVIMGSFVTYFLTEYYKIDPLEIPWVDFFKDEMAKVD